jgi:hypothetical protein
MLRTYQQTYAYGNAFIADMQAIAEAEYGIDLDTFFNQWIYGKGYPRYKITWDQVGTNAIVKLIQLPSCPATTPHFNTPLELQLHAASADTFIKVYNSNDTQVYTFDWPQTVTSVFFNPHAYVLCNKFGNILQDTTLHYTVGVTNVKPYNAKVYPNPSKNYWQVDNLPDDSALTLTDMNGRELWRGRSANGSAIIPGAEIPAGNYLLKVGEGYSIKLVHW